MIFVNALRCDGIVEYFSDHSTFHQGLLTVEYTHVRASLHGLQENGVPSRNNLWFFEHYLLTSMLKFTFTYFQTILNPYFQSNFQRAPKVVEVAAKAEVIVTIRMKWVSGKGKKKRTIMEVCTRIS